MKRDLDLSNKFGREKPKSNAIQWCLFLFFSIFTSYLILLTYSPQFEEPQSSSPSKLVLSQSMKDINVEKNKEQVEREHDKIKSSKQSQFELANKNKKNISYSEKKRTLSSSSFKQTLKDDIQRVKKLLLSGKKWEARNLLENLVANHPENTELLSELSHLYKNDFDDLSLASQVLEKSLRIKPSQPETITEIIGIYDELDQIELGTHLLQNIYDQNPTYSDLAVGIGHSFLIQDRFMDAVHYYEQARQNNNNSEEVLTGLALAYSQTKQFEQSLSIYELVAQKSLEKFSEYKNPSTQDPQSLIEAREDLKEKYLEYWVAARKTGNQDAMLKAQKTLEKIFYE